MAPFFETETVRDVIILKIFLYVLLAVFGLVALILLANIGVSVRIRNDFAVYAHFLFIRINVTKLLSRPKKQKKPVLLKLSDTFEAEGGAAVEKQYKSKAENAVKREKAEKKAGGHVQAETPKKKKSPTELLEMAKQMISDLARYFARFARLRVKRLYAVAASPEPDKTAVLFGEMNIAVSSLLYVCRSYKFFKINDKKVGVYSDFTVDTPLVDAEIRLSLFGWQIVLMGIVLLADYLRKR